MKSLLVRINLLIILIQVSSRSLTNVSPLSSRKRRESASVDIHLLSSDPSEELASIVESTPMYLGCAVRRKTCFITPLNGGLRRQASLQTRFLRYKVLCRGSRTRHEGCFPLASGSPTSTSTRSFAPIAVPSPFSANRQGTTGPIGLSCGLLHRRQRYRLLRDPRSTSGLLPTLSTGRRGFDECALFTMARPGGVEHSTPASPAGSHSGNHARATLDSSRLPYHHCHLWGQGWSDHTLAIHVRPIPASGLGAGV